MSNKGDDIVWSSEIAQNILNENPKTGDINLYLYIGLILIGIVGLRYCFKKA